MRRVKDEVAQDPCGVGALGKEYAEPAAVRVVDTKKLERPLALVTIGEPSPLLQQVIEAYRAEARKRT